MEWFNLIKKYLSEPIAIAIAVFIFSCVIVSQFPKWIVTMKTFAIEKQEIYVSIQKGDSWQQAALLEMELRGLTEQKWVLEDRIDRGQATPRDYRRIELIRKQIDNIEQQKIKLRTYIRECN